MSDEAVVVEPVVDASEEATINARDEAAGDPDGDGSSEIGDELTNLPSDEHNETTSVGTRESVTSIPEDHNLERTVEVVENLAKAQDDIPREEPPSPSTKQKILEARKSVASIAAYDQVHDALTDDDDESHEGFADLQSKEEDDSLTREDSSAIGKKDKTDNYDEESWGGWLKQRVLGNVLVRAFLPSFRNKYFKVGTSRISFAKSKEGIVSKNNGYKELNYTDIHSVVLHSSKDKEVTRFSIVLKKRVRKNWNHAASLTLEAPNEEMAARWVSKLAAKIQIKANIYTIGENGEFPEHKEGVKRSVAYCFSGGGGRAHVATAGQMRALHYLGLLDKADYISAVSAGSWATAIYTFYEDKKVCSSDEELFGAPTTFAGDVNTIAVLDMEKLSSTPPPISRTTNVDMWAMARELIWSTNSHELWERIIARIYLQPFGLGHERPFVHSEEKLEEIRELNPQLKDVRFNVARKNRPFWVANGVIIGPEWSAVSDLVPIQFTPMYVGTPFMHTIHASAKNNRRRRSIDKHASLERTDGPSASPVAHRDHVDLSIGGGFIDTFAFGGMEPSPEQELVKKNSPSPTAARMKKDEKGELNPELHDYVAHAAPHMLKRVFANAKESVGLGEYFQRTFHNTPNPKINMSVKIKEISLPIPHSSFSLRHAVGISSDAPSVNLHDKRLYHRLNAQEMYWNPALMEKPSQRDSIVAEKMDFGDGGSLDNTGILPMLQRKVRRLVVFLNTSGLLPIFQDQFERSTHVEHILAQEEDRDEIHTEEVLERKQQRLHDPLRRTTKTHRQRMSFAHLQNETDHNRCDVTYEEWQNSDVTPLFGILPSDGSKDKYGGQFHHNHVFERRKCRELLSMMQEKWINGEPVCVSQQCKVLENKFWGIKGGWECEIMWCYLEDSTVFRSQLPEDTRNELLLDDDGEFARFPNYKTFGQASAAKAGKYADTQLSIPQINLLSSYCEFCVWHNRSQFKDFVLNAPQTDGVNE